MQRNGFTLIEVLIAIALIAILVGALGPTIVGHVNNARVGRLAGEMQALEKAADTWLDLTGAVDYTGISLAELSDQGIIPSGLTAANANPWGCEYAIDPVDGNANKLRIGARCIPAWADGGITGMFGARAEVTRDNDWVYTTF